MREAQLHRNCPEIELPEGTILEWAPADYGVLVGRWVEIDLGSVSYGPAEIRANGDPVLEARAAETGGTINHITAPELGAEPLPPATIGTGELYDVFFDDREAGRIEAPTRAFVRFSMVQPALPFGLLVVSGDDAALLTLCERSTERDFGGYAVVSGRSRAELAVALGTNDPGVAGEIEAFEAAEDGGGVVPWSASGDRAGASFGGV